MKNKGRHIADFIHDFLCVYLPKRKCRSPQTISSYKAAINLFLDYLEEIHGISFEKLTFEFLDHHVVTGFLDWLENAKNCSVSTQNQRFAALRSFLKFSAGEDVTLMSIYLDMKNVPVKTSMKTMVDHMSLAATTALFDQPDPSTALGIRNLFFMVLIYDSGARLNEILNLKVGDFTTEPPVITVIGKGRKQRRIPISTKTTEHFLQYAQVFHPSESRNADDYLFYTVIHGIQNKMCSATAQSFIGIYGAKARNMCNEVPTKVHPHLLRHTRAMHLYTGGMSLEMLQKILGHSNLKTTEIYAKTDTERKRAAIAKVRHSQETEVDIPVWKDKDTLRKLSGLR
jgi:site-specific recombinase XerD